MKKDQSISEALGITLPESLVTLMEKDRSKRVSETLVKALQHLRDVIIADDSELSSYEKQCMLTGYLIGCNTTAARNYNEIQTLRGKLLLMGIMGQAMQGEDTPGGSIMIKFPKELSYLQDPMVKLITSLAQKEKNEAIATFDELLKDMERIEAEKKAKGKSEGKV
jgi:hypothetical protein